MLFNSLEFLFLFLPITLGVFIMLKRFFCGQSILLFLGAVSLIFYAAWDAKYLALLLFSISANYYIGKKLSQHVAKKLWLILGLAFNLVCLSFFKYFDFFILNINTVLTMDMSAMNIILPLGISFFTFQQIAFLVDSYKEEPLKYSFCEYLVFVSFFPQLIAGPIVHHKEMLPQFGAICTKAYDWKKASLGLFLFSFGLFKKVIFADSIAAYVSPIYNAVGAGQSVDFLQAWAATFGYSLQLYFDFSGYTDMAIGLGLLFGLSLPVNFLSPYKSKSIIEFWRKWHITLSQFLKDYLYIPLGGNRKGTIRRYTNLMITMVLGGLWHGAGWTFVLWGGLHGTYLVVNHLWGEFISPKYKTLKTYNAISWLLTLLAVSVAWVFFRCENVSGALEIVSSMFWYNGEETVGYKNAASFTDVWYWIIIGYMVVLFSPNAQEIISSFMHKKPKQWYSFYISWRWMVITIGTLLTSLFFIVYKVNRISEFIYFQF